MRLTKTLIFAALTALAVPALAQTPDKKPLYVFGEIPSKFYKNIQDGYWSSSVKTVSWETMVYIDQNMDEKAQSALIDILMKSSSNIKNQFGR